jgi:hypothetical protein
MTSHFNSLAGTTSALQQEFLVDDHSSYFQVLHKRGQRVVKHERIVQPSNAISGDVSGRSIMFQILPEGHMMNKVWLTYQLFLTPAFLSALTAFPGGSTFGQYELTFQDLWGMKGIDHIDVDYSGEHITTITRDELRFNYSLFMNDAEKKAEREQCTDSRLGNVVSERSYNIDPALTPFNGGPNYCNQLSVTYNQGTDGTENLYQRKLPNGWMGSPLADREGSLMFSAPVFDISGGYGSGNGGGVGALDGSTQVITPQMIAMGITLRARVQIPWTHDMTTDRNLPRCLLGQDPTFTVFMATPQRLIMDLDGGIPNSNATTIVSLAKSGGMQFLNPNLIVEFRDQPAPAIEALAKEPSIVYPQSFVLRERFFLPAGQAIGETSFQIQNIHGLVHTFLILIRPVGAVEGQPIVALPSTGPPNDYTKISPNLGYRGGQVASQQVVGLRLYDDDWLDMNMQPTAFNPGTYVTSPGSQRCLQSFNFTSNNERISGKINVDGAYNLTQYRQNFFPNSGEGIRHYAFHTTGSAAPNYHGWNGYAYTFGLDGARESVGTGVINVDGLASMQLNLQWIKTNADHMAHQPANFDQYVDLYSLGANFTVISKGNWRRQLA